MHNPEKTNIIKIPMIVFFIRYLNLEDVLISKKDTYFTNIIGIFHVVKFQKCVWWIRYYKLQNNKFNSTNDKMSKKSIK